MFDIGSSELLLIIVVAVVVIGPKDLPRALYKFGQLVGKGKAMARHFRTGLDAMVREAELEELQKKWAAENARIMAEHPPTAEQAGEIAAAEAEAPSIDPSSPEAPKADAPTDEGGPDALLPPPAPAPAPAPEPAATPFAPVSLASAQADLPLPLPDEDPKRTAP